MTDDARELTRRRLLGATGAAVAGLGAVGPAAGDHFIPGQRASITTGVQAYNDACPNRNLGPIYEAGTSGRAWEYCIDDAGEMVYFEPEPGYDKLSGWVPESYLTIS